VLMKTSHFRQGKKIKLKAYSGNGGTAHAFLTSALGGGEWSASRSGRFTPVKEPLVPIG
jgi:hypothetical protein